MLLTYAITILIILGLLAGWIGVQHLARSFAARNPELGPAREEGGGCGGLFCLCKEAGNCKRKQLKKAVRSRS
jgi:hypothetical protein